MNTFTITHLTPLSGEVPEVKLAAGSRVTIEVTESMADAGDETADLARTFTFVAEPGAKVAVK